MRYILKTDLKQISKLYHSLAAKVPIQYKDVILSV